MKKIIILLSISLLILGMVWIFYVFVSGKNEIPQGQISQRAKEHIESQKKSQDDQLWRNVNFESKRLSEEELNKQYLTFDGCYRLNVPFEVIKEEERGECTNALALMPSGWLVISYKDSDQNDLNNLSGVNLRRSKKQEYNESQKKNGDVNYIIFTKTGSEYESSAFLLLNGKLLTISLTSPSNENFDAKFNQILDSIELY